MTKIIRCDCKHATQDRLYGAEMRVHNRTQKATAPRVGWRCTVCRKEREQ
ncbi:MAG: hypothetical protein Q8R78_04340 [Candidatus Omnitrophota bacterium]|nr:hypothetical protein [Candidatus Omnitrophota bacterium]